MNEEIVDIVTNEELIAYANCMGEVNFEVMEYDLKRMAIEILNLRKAQSWQPLTQSRQEMGG